ncbi:recombinase family protein [Paenibacillus cisolokensis]|uniref:recombinase family protein n=1 Tax=Paenibacillus cisolokensis TaxID=1658519 RepID=UPI001FD3E674|nr:recombinase family protein [Paenibacillus cisolokensis]
MYHWYVYDHYTFREIGERLYSLGAVPKRGESRNWSASSIRRVLTSEVYIGKFYYNRRETRKIRGEKTKNGTPKKTISSAVKMNGSWSRCLPSLTRNYLHWRKRRKRKT